MTVNIDSLNRSEALRYLSCHDEEAASSIPGIDECERELLKFLRPSFIYRYFDISVKGTHFISEDGDYHVDRINTYISDKQSFNDIIMTDVYDSSSKNLMLYPPHDTHYFPGNIATTFTVARNYFDTTGSIVNPEYIGTLYIDVDIEALRRIAESYTPTNGETIVFMVNEKCWISSDPSLEGKIFDPASLIKKGDMMSYDTDDRKQRSTGKFKTSGCLWQFLP